MMLPKISVQIPTYNQAGYINQAVDSVLAQQYNNLEVVIADDCSTDNTGQSIDKYLADSRVKIGKNTVNLGRIGNYRKSLYEYCSGDWVVNLDGDDFFCDSCFLSRAMELIQANKQEHIVLYQANHDLQKLKKIFPQAKRLDEETILINGRDYFINYYKVQRFKHCATLYSRQEALKLDFYSFNCLFTDFNSMAKLMLRGKLVLSAKKVAQWREHEGNESGGLNERTIEKEMQSIDQLADIAKPFFSNDQLVTWANKMKEYMVTTYIELLTKKPVTLQSIKYVLKKFRWNTIYFRQFVKLILGTNR